MTPPGRRSHPRAGPVQRDRFGVVEEPERIGGEGSPGGDVRQIRCQRAAPDLPAQPRHGLSAGSREGLLAAIVATIEAQQRAVMAALTEQAGSPREVMLGLWEQLTRPELLPFVRLFFEVFGLLAQDTPGTRPLRESLTGPWVAEGLAGAERLGVAGDPAELRVGIAVTRGLLLELVAGTPLADVDAAYRRFVDLYDTSAGREATSQSSAERRART